MTTKKAINTRAEFIAYNRQQTKTWLCNQISKETGDDWSSRHDMTAVELATKLADLQGWSNAETILVDTEDAEIEVELTDAEMDAYEIQAATAEDSIQDEIAAGNVDEDEAPAPKAKKVKAPKPEAEKKSIATLLDELRAEKTQAGRKRIRVQLRAQGYRLSDQPKPAKAPKEKKTIAAPTSPTVEKAKKGKGKK